MSAPNIPLPAYKRVPFDKSIAIMGVDYSGATLAADIRAAPGDTGTAIVALTGAAPPDQGLSVTYNAGYPDPDGVLPNGASLVRMIVSEATLEGLALGADPSKPVELHYDIHLTPSGGTKFIFCAGKFIIEPGVTL